MNTMAQSISQQLSHQYLNTYPKDAARAIEKCSIEQMCQIIQSQSVKTALSLLFYMTPENKDKILNNLPTPFLIDLLTAMDISGCANYLTRASDQKKTDILNQLPSDFAQQVSDYLDFGVDIAGSLMDKVSHAYYSDMSVGEVIEQIRATKTTPSLYIFVIDRENKLIGRVNIQLLLGAEDNQMIGALSAKTPPSVLFLAPKVEIIEAFEKSAVDVLPVVDAHQKLVGLLYSSKILNVIKDTITSDIQTMVGASAEEKALSPSLFAIRKRLPWLLINLATAFLAAAVVGAFEGIIAKHVALAVLLPVVAGQSGNAGAQALAVTMRGLAVREISLMHWLNVFIKEAAVGLLSGTAIALVCAVLVYFWSNSIGLCFVLLVSMIISVAVACVCGALIPICLKKLGQDPAQSSSIILTTFTDVIGFFSFLGIATIMTKFL